MIYEKNSLLDPQLTWQNKNNSNTLRLAVPILQVYVHEKIHPNEIINNLKEEVNGNESTLQSNSLFDLQNEVNDKIVDYYQHEENWYNRMILGDSLIVMTSLAEKEGLKGKVQMIYFDPPYGIKFGSNWQVSTRKRDVKDGKTDDVTREPEQIKAFRDTWKLGIHSYLSYLLDRLIAARELLSETGSIFVQIGDDNVHLVRCLMDEVFGRDNFVRLITFAKTGYMYSNVLGRISDYIIWYAKSKPIIKYRPLYTTKSVDEFYNNIELPDGSFRKLEYNEAKSSILQQKNVRVFRLVSLESPGSSSEDTPIMFQGKVFRPHPSNHWKSSYPDGMSRLIKSGRVVQDGQKLRWKYYIDDYPLKVISEVWLDTAGFNPDQRYVVETRVKVVKRCLLMTTDPGDLVLDPTCGSGTTAYVAEQWGRRWITIDTSRVALTLARTRLMTAKYPYYLLANSSER